MNTNSILVVEDDAGLREALIDTLEMSGIGASLPTVPSKQWYC